MNPLFEDIWQVTLIQANTQNQERRAILEDTLRIMYKDLETRVAHSTKTPLNVVEPFPKEEEKK